MRLKNFQLDRRINKIGLTWLARLLVALDTFKLIVIAKYLQGTYDVGSGLDTLVAVLDGLPYFAFAYNVRYVSE